MCRLTICIIVAATLALQVATTARAVTAAAAAAAGQTLQAANGLQCQRITVPACQGLGYNMTAMPNLAGHTNQLEAELRVSLLHTYIQN